MTKSSINVYFGVAYRPGQGFDITGIKPSRDACEKTLARSEGTQGRVFQLDDATGTQLQSWLLELGLAKDQAGEVIQEIGQEILKMLGASENSTWPFHSNPKR